VFFSLAGGAGADKLHSIGRVLVSSVPIGLSYALRVMIIYPILLYCMYVPVRRLLLLSITLLY